MVRIKKDRIVIELKTTEPEEDFIGLKNSLLEMIWEASLSGNGSPERYLFDIKRLLQEMELDPCELKKLIESDTVTKDK